MMLPDCARPWSLGLLCLGVLIGALVVVFLFVAERHFRRRQAALRRLERRAHRKQNVLDILDSYIEGP